MCDMDANVTTIRKPNNSTLNPESQNLCRRAVFGRLQVFLAFIPTPFFSLFSLSSAHDPFTHSRAHVISECLARMHAVVHSVVVVGSTLEAGFNRRGVILGPGFNMWGVLLGGAKDLTGEASQNAIWPATTNSGF